MHNQVDMFKHARSGIDPAIFPRSCQWTFFQIYQRTAELFITRNRLFLATVFSQCSTDLYQFSALLSYIESHYGIIDWCRIASFFVTSLKMLLMNNVAMETIEMLLFQDVICCFKM